MTCDHCHEREAKVELTQIAEGQVNLIHLCERCAAEKGVETAAALQDSTLGVVAITVSDLHSAPSGVPSGAPSGAPYEPGLPGWLLLSSAAGVLLLGLSVRRWVHAEH